jgi:hypothetical protein
LVIHAYSHLQTYTKNIHTGALGMPPIHAPIIIDGVNVAWSHASSRRTFSTEGLQIVIEFFRSKGYSNVLAFVPHTYAQVCFCMCICVRMTYVHTHIYICMYTNVHAYIHTYRGCNTKGSERVWQAARTLQPYMHTYTCIHTHVHTHIHTYIHTYMLYMHTYTCIHMYAPIHTYMHTYMHAYIHTYAHIYIHTRIHTFIHTYIHAHMHTFLHSYIQEVQHNSQRVRVADNIPLLKDLEKRGYVCMYVFICMRVCVCMCARMCLCLHGHK